MNLYAIRDKETGRFLYRAGNKWTLELFNGEFWLEGTPAFLTTTMAMAEKELETELELVTLRVEPTEPCIICHLSAYAELIEKVGMVFCPKCSRKLDIPSELDLGELQRLVEEWAREEE